MAAKRPAKGSRPWKRWDLGTTKTLFGPYRVFGRRQQTYVDGLIIKLKVAQNSFQHFPRPLFINRCYNYGIRKLPSHWWTRWYYFRHTIGYHNNNDLPKTPLILALTAYNSIRTRWPPFFISELISMIRCNFLQSLKKFCEEGSEPP